jgi:hypothetical protein
MSKKSDVRKAAEWLKRLDPSEITKAVEFINGFEKQLHEKPRRRSGPSSSETTSSSCGKCGWS